MTGLGEPSAVMTTGGLYCATSRRSSSSRLFVEWVIMLATHGPSPGDRALVIWSIQRSRSSTVRQFGVGKAPAIPALHAAITISGPLTRNMGAAMMGRRIEAAIEEAGAVMLSLWVRLRKRRSPSSSGWP
jgi:hypothetical protein